MSTQLAAGHIALSVKYSSAMSQISKDITGLETAAKKSGDKAGKSISTSLVKGSNEAGTKAGRSWSSSLLSSANPAATGKRVGDQFGKAAESSVVSSAQRTGKGFMSKIASVMKPVAAAAAIATPFVGVGTVISKGLSRLSALDDAKAKLAALGHETASVEKIMDSALASVKGTAFGMDAAATIAASAVAAGVKPGEELTKYLSLTADAAAVANISLDEMGQILNKTTTRGEVYTDSLNQLADRGIPVFQWLQEEYKVTGDELSKMVSDGKVDAATLRRVLETNIGGAAQKTGESTSGALSNMNAAISRLGAALMGPVFNVAKTVFNNLTGVFDRLTDVAGPAMERFGEIVSRFFSTTLLPAFQRAWPAIQAFFSELRDGAAQVLPLIVEKGQELFERFGPAISDLLTSIVGAVQNSLPTIKTIATGIGAALLGVVEGVKAFGPPLIGALSKVIGFLGRISPLLIPIAAGFAAFKAFTLVLTTITLATKAWSAAQAVLNGVLALNPIGLIVAAIAALVAGLVLLYTKNETFRNAVQTAWAAIKTAFSAAWNVIKAVFQGIGTGAMFLWNNAIKPAFNGIKFVIQVWWAYIQIVFKLAQIALKALGKVFAWLWRNAVRPAFNGIKSLISAAWSVIQPVWNQLKAGLEAVGEGVLWLWSNAFEPAWEKIKNGVSTAWDFIKGIFDKVKDGFNTLKRGVVGVANAIKEGIESAFSGLADIIKAPLRALGGFLSGIPDSILGVDIPGAGTLKNWGKNLQKLRRGGVVRGPGTGTSDSILAWLSDGEGVVTAKAMANGGATLVAALNAGWTPSAEFLHQMIPGFAEGLNPGADFLRRQIMKLWPQVTRIGGRRSEDGLGEHSTGNAIDVMIPGYNTPEGKALGDAIASWVVANAEVLGLDGLIWRQTSYGYGGSFTHGKPMPDRGSDTQNHMDHLHIILGKGRGAGAPAVDLPTGSLSLPSGRSYSPGSSSSSSKKVRNAQDRVADLEAALATKELALQEAKDSGAKESTIKAKADAVEKAKRDLERAKQDLADLEASGSDSGSDNSSSDNPYLKIMEGIKEILPNFGDLANIGVDGLKESFLPPGFSDPTEWGVPKALSGILGFVSGLIKGDGGPILRGIANILSGNGSGAVDAFMSLAPKPFGDKEWDDEATETITEDKPHLTPNGSSPGPGNTYVPDPDAGRGGGDTYNDNSVHVAEGGQIGTDPVRVMDKAHRQQAAQQRPHLGTRRFI